ncbi:MAG: hypothetical protein ACRBC3_19310 [Burkholderiaceae bacterium]
MLTLIIVLKAGAELALLLILARSLVFAMSLGRHEENPVHRVLQAATMPIDTVARKLSPRLILNRHLPVVSFFLMLWLWIALVLAKVWWSGGAHE